VTAGGAALKLAGSGGESPGRGESVELQADDAERCFTLLVSCEPPASALPLLSCDAQLEVLTSAELTTCCCCSPAF